MQSNLKNEALDPDTYSNSGVIGNNLPGSWRPFNDDSPWNTPIAADAKTHPLSEHILATMQQERDHLALINTYLAPIWVVNSKNLSKVRVRSDRIFDEWDQDRDGWTDDGAPVTRDMWAEPTGDGQICIVDPFQSLLWDISTFRWPDPEPFPMATTFDIWDLKGSGVADPPADTNWVLRGGRGSGFPGIAGLIRPEELEAGEIRHSLCFSFNKNRQHESGANIFLPPACRSDGRHVGSQYPIEGMRFQLDPKLTKDDFDSWGLNREGLILAKALQEYGMYLGLSGGAMKIEVQQLGPTTEQNRQEWENRFPGFYENVERIPSSAFRVIDTGEPMIRMWHGGLGPDRTGGS